MAYSNMNISCIPSNPDISGIGVRTAVYAQNLLSLVPAFWALADKKVTPTELESLETQSSTILITAFALLISTIIQVVTEGLTSYHVTVILNLSWINNTNTFIYLLLYFYRRVDLETTNTGDADESDYESDDDDDDTVPRTLPARRKRSVWRKEIPKMMRNPVLIIGSLHLSLMAAVGIWMWARPLSFGLGYHKCVEQPSVVVLGGSIPIDSRGLQVWSLLIYSTLLVPGVNLILPSSFFLGIFWLHRGVEPRMRLWLKLESKDDRSEEKKHLMFKRSIAPVALSLALLAIVDIILLVDTERAITANAPLLDPGDSQWSFGQTLSLLLLLVPLRDLGETIWERHPKELGRRLLEAARKGKLDVIEYLLEVGAPLEARDHKYGYTPLQFAAKKGHGGVVIYLAKRGAEVNLQDRNGGIPLMGVAKSGHLEAVTTLLEKGVDIHAKDKNNRTALTEAAEAGHLETIIALLEKHADIHAMDVTGNCALAMATGRDHDKFAQWIIVPNAKFDTTDKRSRAPLSIVAESRNMLVVKFFVDTIRASIPNNITTANLLSEAKLAAKRRDLEMVKYLLVRSDDEHEPDGPTPLMIAIRHGQMDLVRFLIENSESINSPDNNGRSVVHHAVDSCHMEMVQLLFKLGVRLDMADNNGITPLMLAVQVSPEPVTEIVNFLIEKATNLDARDKLGRAAVHYAAQTRQSYTFLRLVESGAQLGIADNDGIIPLMLVASTAYSNLIGFVIPQLKSTDLTRDNLGRTVVHYATQGDPENLEYFSARGAPLDEPDDKGTTPLMLAASESCAVRKMEYLIHHSCKVNAEDALGRTVAHYAAQNIRPHPIKWLSEHGVPIDTADNNGDTPLMLARKFDPPKWDSWYRKKHRDVIDFLVAKTGETVDSAVLSSPPGSS